MKVNKSLLAVLSMFLILLLFISSASAADTNETDVLSVDESVNLENNTLALDAASNDNNAVENDEILQNPNTDDILGITVLKLDFPTEITVGEEFSFSYETDCDVDTLSLEFFDAIHNENDLGTRETLSFTYNGNERDLTMVYLAFFAQDEFVRESRQVTIKEPTPVTDTWYVNSSATGGDGKSPETAFKTLNDALTNSELQDGNTIMIASGTYTGSENTGLTIYFLDKTINNLNFIKYGDSEAIFDAENQKMIWTALPYININGLTFKNGRDNGSWADVAGAITFVKGGNVTNCIFTGNTAVGNGGAIFFREGFSYNSVTNCTFINNTANDFGGAIYSEYSASVTDCTFTGNTALSAGAIYVGQYGCNVTDCTFTGNTAVGNGGAIAVYGTSVTSVTNCTFTGNTALAEDDNGGYGGAIAGTMFSVTNCTFTGNTATFGGAIAMDRSNVTNCVFVNNNANTGSAIYTQTLNQIKADNNWWGSNNPNWDNLIIDKDGNSFTPSVYAVLNVTADPTEIDTSGQSTIATKFVWNGTTIDATNSLPKRNVKLSSNGTLSETDGIVGLTSEFSATTGGIYYVNATVDNETIGVNVKVNGSGPTPEPIPTDITVNPTSLDLTVGETSNIIATLNPPEAGELVFTSNDTNIATVETDPFGNTVIKAVAEGSAIITVSFPGNEQYAPAENRTVTVTVSDKPTPRKDLNISGSAEPIIAGENATVIVTGFENATGDVTARIDGGLLSTTIVNGTATFNVPGLTLNTTAYINYKGDANYNNASTTVQITVYPNPDRKNLTLNATSEPIIAGENATIIVTGFENATGDVTARIDGGLLSTTIVNGTATFILPNMTSSTTAYISYGGNEEYNAASTTVNITVIPKSDVVIVAENVTKYYGGSERLVANVYDSELNPIANKTVSITINRITYTRTTDENGTVSLAINLGSGTYGAIIQVDSTSVKSYITVLSTLTGNDITKYYRNATQYSVQVFDTTGKVVGKGEVVTFNVNGRFYNRTTDENGIATLNINLPQGEYVITATNPVTGEMHSNNINVLPVVAAKDITMKYMDGTQFVATLVDGQGNPYKDQFVTFNVNGILYNRLTDSNGQAALNIRLIPGEYIITSSFNGCNIANKITITG